MPFSRWMIVCSMVLVACSGTIGSGADSGGTDGGAPGDVASDAHSPPDVHSQADVHSQGDATPPGSDVVIRNDVTQVDVAPSDVVLTSEGGPPTDVTPPPTLLPVIVSFTATPSTLAAGGGMTTLAWQVQNATSLSIDNGIGTVTGTSTMTNVSATTVFTLTATNANGSAMTSTSVSVGSNPSTAQGGGLWVAMISPTGGETFIAPATLRLQAAGFDINIYTNMPVCGQGENASRVQFFVDDTMVLEEEGTMAEYYVFKGTTSGIMAGQHRVWARAIYDMEGVVLDSPPTIITVVDPPTYGQTVNLTQNVVLSGSQGYSLVGSAGSRIRLNGNGFTITSADGASGNLDLEYVDVFGLGSASDPTQTSVEVTTTGTATIANCTFDTSDTVHLVLNGNASASIQGNTLRSNMRVPEGQEPGSPTSYPAILFEGSSTGNKVFAGNNIGAGWASFQTVQNWVIGGDTDADSNILIGPRVGIYVNNSSNVQVRRNYSHHVYYGGWSQGANFELESSPNITVEHNVIYNSSWPVRGVGCEFRYNLVLSAGHEWLWVEPNGSIHHNVFVGGDQDIGGIFVLYNPPNVNFFNNTLDGSLSPGAATAVNMEDGDFTMTSNAMVGYPVSPMQYATVALMGGNLTSDYNLFYNDPQQPDYADGRTPAHDINGVAPRFSAPPTQDFNFDESAIWQRTTAVSTILYSYRMMYTPAAGSPLIDTGDPSGGAGNDIGAVGAGQANAADLFGLP